MKEQVYRIIKAAIEKNRILLPNELKQIAYVLIDEFELKKYVKKVKFLEENVMGYYKYDRKEASFSYNYILDCFNGEAKTFINFMLVQALLHELNHARHYKLMDEKSFPQTNSVDKAYEELINYSYITNFKNIDNYNHSYRYLMDQPGVTFEDKYTGFYLDYHGYFPMERFCDLDASKYLQQLVLKYEKDETKQKRYFDMISLIYYKDLLYGYDGILLKLRSKVNGPSEFYLKITEQQSEAKVIEKLRNEIINENPYDTKSLLYLGLDVPSKTIQNLRKYTKDLNDELHNYFAEASENEIYTRK